MLISAADISSQDVIECGKGLFRIISLIETMDQCYEFLLPRVVHLYNEMTPPWSRTIFVIMVIDIYLYTNRLIVCPKYSPISISVLQKLISELLSCKPSVFYIFICDKNTYFRIGAPLDSHVPLAHTS